MKTGYWLVSCLAAVALCACGHHSGGDTDANGDDGDGGNGVIDAGFGMDAPFTGTCTPGSAQCSNCVDDDQDTKVDGFDPECTGPLDNDESSFKTGIPGDNIDATDQDCFFDGNSGSGNDGCSQHTCCLLQAGGATTATNDDRPECTALTTPPGAVNVNKYTRSECYTPFGSTAVPPKCSMVCGPLAPPGCDCFGCCKICNADGCRAVDINPAVSPLCDSTNLNDPGADGILNTGDDPCKGCTPNDSCGNPTCGGATCVLCPGQDPSTLPASCNNTTTCPMGLSPCDSGGNCPEGTYCSSGCCIGTIL